MGNLHLVTGYAGQPHISAADHATLFESTVRSGQFVTAAGAQFAAAVITNNTVRISDGELVMQGRHIKMERGSYVDLPIENGSQGSMRRDLVVARFSRNAETGVEECSLVVIKGTAVTSDPLDPDCITGNINAEDQSNDFPLFRIPINGLSVGEPVRLFTPYKSVFDYLESALAGLLPLIGGTMLGHLDMGSNQIRNVHNVVTTFLNGTRVRSIGQKTSSHTQTLERGGYSAYLFVAYCTTSNGTGGGGCAYFVTAEQGATTYKSHKIYGEETANLAFACPNAEKLNVTLPAFTIAFVISLDSVNA